MYTARGHFEAARTWGRVHLLVGVPTALIAAVAGVSAFNDHPTLAGSAAIAVAALSSISTFLNPSERAQAHQLAGARFNALRSQARFLREVGLLTTRPDKDLTSAMEDLCSSRDQYNQESPSIPRPAFVRARKGIEEGEANYAVDQKTASAPSALPPGPDRSN